MKNCRKSYGTLSKPATKGKRGKVDALDSSKVEAKIDKNRFASPLPTYGNLGFSFLLVYLNFNTNVQPLHRLS